MSRKVKIFIFILYFCIFVLSIILILSIFTNFGKNITQTIFLPKYYIKFDDLDKVKVCYKSNNFSNEILLDATYFEIEVTDEEFLKLLEDSYQNKIVNDYFTGGILSKGQYKIVINDNIELYTCGLNGFYLDYNNCVMLVKFQPEIYEKIVDIVDNKLKQKNSTN